jgi:nucleoid DNA-binding protein
MLIRAALKNLLIDECEFTIKKRPGGFLPARASASHSNLQPFKSRAAMTLTKTNIIGAVSDRTGFTMKKSRHSVNTLIEIIKRTLESGETIKVSHFGKFEVKERKRRRCRNPRTGAEIMVPAKRVVAFKSFKRLKDLINAQPGGIYRADVAQTINRTVHTGATNSKELKKILDDHRRWLESEGQSGEKATLIGARLVRADLYGLRLSRVNFQGADLRGADLSEADLYEANLEDARLNDATLEWASLDGASLKRADLQGADLRWANLEGTNLTGANLRLADFEGANLKGAKLSEADLYGTNLKNTDMQGAVLTRIKLDYETQLNLPKPIFEKYRQTFRVLEWSPVLVPSA